METAVIVLAALLVAAFAVIAYLMVAWQPRADAARQEEQFKLLANSIFAQNSRQLREDSERRFTEVLDPIRQNLADFKQAITEQYNREARERFSLQEQVRQLVQLNDTIGREARQLTSALKGNTQVQGHWGEMILENILEHSGLRKGEEYELQKTTSTDQGDRLRPDAILTFPDGRKLVIDSKVSLKSYVDLCQAQGGTQAKVLGRMHVASIKNHINELRTKNYQAYVGKAKADFVMMFIPNEGAYLAAMQSDPALWEYAYDSSVVIVSPTHLMSVVKLVEQTWQHERQDQNAMRIAQEGGRLIDKLVAFLADMDRVGSALSTAQKACDAAMTKLNGRGGIISRAETLQALGAKSTKHLPDTVQP